jgi:uncharacterized membrane protein YhaH (DUF805 family)
MDWFLDALKNKYAQFDGRAGREEFWMYSLFYIILYIALNIVDYLLHIRTLTAIFSLVILIPSLAVTTRRLHDTNRSGWWQLLCFIPLIGWVILLLWYITDSDSGRNQYGINPKLN